jgi:glycosyltransferase involved in cell wall biosynthesis
MIHTPFWSRSGGERQILKLAVELQEHGHEVKIFTSGVNEESYPDLFRKVSVEVIPHPLAGKLPHGFVPEAAQPNIDLKTFEKADEAPQLRKWIRKMIDRQFYTSEFPAMLELGRKIPTDFDLINNHNFPTEWAAFIAKKRLKAPIVWMCNEPPYWFYNPKFRNGLNKINWPLFEVLDKLSVNYIDEIMVLSKVGAGYVQKAYGRSSRVVRTGVDTELLQSASGKSVRKMYGVEKDFVLLQAGSIDPVKRQADTVKALHYLSKKYDNVKVIFDGPGSREELEALSKKLELRQKILFLHSKNDEELAGVYASCDAFIYPSSTSTWGMGPTEAMAASKPVIISKRAGVSEIVQDGVNGMVIDCASPEEIARKVELLINNPELRQKMGQRAYEYIKSNLSWEKYAQRVENVFQETLRRKK